MDNISDSFNVYDLLNRGSYAEQKYSVSTIKVWNKSFMSSIKALLWHQREFFIRNFYQHTT